MLWLLCCTYAHMPCVCVCRYNVAGNGWTFVTTQSDRSLAPAVYWRNAFASIGGCINYPHCPLSDIFMFDPTTNMTATNVTVGNIANLPQAMYQVAAISFNDVCLFVLGGIIDFSVPGTVITKTATSSVYVTSTCVLRMFAALLPYFFHGNVHPFDMTCSQRCLVPSWCCHSILRRHGCADKHPVL